jgi:hypothetical protein
VAYNNEICFFTLFISHIGMGRWDASSLKVELTDVLLCNIYSKLML